MFIVITQIAIYIVVSALFGFIIGRLLSRSERSQTLDENELKSYKVISEKNNTIIKLKNELRAASRKIDAISLEYQQQVRLVQAKEQELKKINSKTSAD